MPRPHRASPYGLLLALVGACGGGEETTTTAAEPTSAGTTTFDPALDTTAADTGPLAPACSVRSNDCPPDNKCTVVPTATGETEHVCVPILGDDRPGEACELEPGGHGRDSCAAGSMCAGDPPDRQCVAFCGPDDACAEAKTCVRLRTDEPGGEGLPLCLDECLPLQAPCPTGWACTEDPGARRWYCAPRLGGQDGGYGSPCDRTQLGLCAPGFACLVDPALAFGSCEPSTIIGCCAQLCDLAGTPTCPGEGEQCLPFYPDAPPPGFADLGVCALPGGS